MRKTLTKTTALIAFALPSGTVLADQTTKTTAQLAIEQFNECAGSLFKDEFEPAVGRSAVKEMIITQNGQSSDEPPPTAAKVKEYIGKVFEECPPQKEDYDCADAVIDRFNGIEQIVRHNLEYPNVTVEKYTSNEQSFRASKEVRNGIDDYQLTLNGATDHKSFVWRTLRPLTPTAVEEVLHNPPPRVAKNGSDIRKLQACMENITPHIEIIPR